MMLKTGGSRYIGRKSIVSVEDLHGVALHRSARLLVAASSASGAVFAAYIIAFFGGAAANGVGQRCRRFT